ncbi:MAG: hypothetical protein ACREFM_09680 [Hypericibacter sp.]
MMTDASITGNGSIFLPDNPPNVVVTKAKSQARALQCPVYIYWIRSSWVTTTDPHEPPSEGAVWMIPANENDPDSAS